MSDECCKKNFFASLADTAMRVVRDPKMVPDEVREERLAICNDCEHLKNGQCDLCGCFVLPKSHFANMACPKGKWKEFTNPVND